MLLASSREHGLRALPSFDSQSHVLSYIPHHSGVFLARRKGRVSRAGVSGVTGDSRSGPNQNPERNRRSINH